MASEAERAMRAAVRAELAARAAVDPGAFVAEEMGVWSGTVRIDLALVGNAALEGFELKSDRDRLARLAAQRDFYNCVFDRLSLVTAPRHLEEARRAVPDWWGLAVVQGRGCSVEWIREAAPNLWVEPMMVARLVWKEEALALLVAAGRPARRSMRVDDLHALVADLGDAAEVGRLVRDVLSRRAGWRCRWRPQQAGGVSDPVDSPIALA